MKRTRTIRQLISIKLDNLSWWWRGNKEGFYAGFKSGFGFACFVVLFAAYFVWGLS